MGYKMHLFCMLLHGHDGQHICCIDFVASFTSYRTHTFDVLLCTIISLCNPGNRPHPTADKPPFTDEDPRKAFALQSCDPRIHFALVCGAKVRETET